MGKTAIVAIGGNALVPDNRHTAIADQFVAAAHVAAPISGMIAAGWTVVVTHGNGPQVGFILRRSDLAARIAPEIPRLKLDLCVADSQGGIGYIVGNSLANQLRREGVDRGIATVITQTVVDAGDPAFANPTKPIGTWYTKEEAESLQASEGWAIVEDAGRGWRRVVPSPKPVRVVELDAIAALVAAGFTVIAGGGGGIPVVEERDGSLRGVEAVVDKDYLSAVLAAGLGADLLVLTTGVPQVAVNFGKPDQRFLDRIDLEEARGHLADGQFPPGSMGPKISAAIQFLESGGGEALITSPDLLADALAGRTGTRIVARALAGQGGG
jgi:carbamate kinase